MKRLIVTLVIIVIIILTAAFFAVKNGLIAIRFPGADTSLTQDAKPHKPSAATEQKESPDAEKKETAQTDNIQNPPGPAEPTDKDPQKSKPEQPGHEQAQSEQTESEPSEPKPAEPGQAEQLEAVNLNNIEMKDIIQKIGDWTAKPVIPVNDEILAQRITIYSSEKVTRTQALSLVYAALRAKGIVAEHTEDKIFLKPISQARLGVVPTLGVDEPLARIENRSQIVEKFFKLTNYSPARIVEIIAPLIAEYGHVTAIETTGNIAVIDTVENLIRIQRVIEQLDVPESEPTIEKVFEVHNVDPAELVQILELILSGPRQGRSAEPTRPSAPPAAPGAGKDAKPASSVVIEPGKPAIKLITVPKHNWIIARGSPDDIEAVEEWVRKLDIVESVEREQTIVQIKYADVREVVNIVKNTIQQTPGSELQTSIVVEALPQNKQIVIVGNEENRKMVEKLIAEIDLPSMDIFVEKTFKLKHADPDQIKQNIEGLYETAPGSFSTYGYRSYSSRFVSPEDAVKIISYPTLKQVTVLASEKNLGKIEKQIAEWDIPLDIGKDQYRIVTLKNSDPVKMVELLSKLFSEQQESSMSLLNVLFGRGSEEKKKIVGSLYGMLTFEAVADTKKIIVISKIPEAYDIIEKLIHELDKEEEGEVPKIITLNTPTPKTFATS